jgi:hypothetical protein
VFCVRVALVSNTQVSFRVFCLRDADVLSNRLSSHYSGPSPFLVVVAARALHPGDRVSIGK